MPSYSFVHAADLHLDSPFKGLKRTAPRIAQVLKNSTFDAYNAILDFCIQEKVDALLIAGDIFDSADQSLSAQLRFVDGLKRLEAAGIRSFICHGNHDPLDSWHSQVTFPPNSCRFDSTVGSSELRVGDPESPIVYGYSYPVREVRENVIPLFSPEIQPGRIGIGLLHANVGSDTGHDSYAPCTTEDLSNIGIKYWALGHVHRRQELSLPDGVAVYPGNTQGRHINERGARGVYLVKINEAGTFNQSFRPMDLVRWEQIEIDISSHDERDPLEQSIERAIDQSLQRSENRHLIYRIRLTGRGPLHSLVSRSEYVETLTTTLNETWTERSPFAYCDRITSSTQSAINREDYLKREDFLGDLVRLFDQLKGDTEGDSEFHETLNQLYQNPRLRKYLADGLPNGNDIKELLDGAESICLDLLANEESDED
jgi:exonuclease SbcD